MILFLLPLLAIGAYAWHEHRAHETPALPAPAKASGEPVQLADGSVVTPLYGGGGSTPLRTVQAFLRLGYAPPPELASWAVAEAEALGRFDVARELHCRYVAPYIAPPDAVAPVSPTAPVAPTAPVPAAMPPEIAAEMAAQAAAQAQALPVPAPALPNALPRAIDGAPIVSVSPIQGVSDHQWGAFAQRLVRHEPTYNGPRRVGRYGASKTRLAALGIAPDSIVGDPAAQDEALAIDLHDGFERAHKLGITRHIGQPVTVPGVAEAPVVTPSGLLGVLSVAGAEGARGWFDHPEERERFAFTSNVFLQTNGIY